MSKPAETGVTTSKLKVVDGADVAAAPTVSESRDETHDSIDPQTGALTAEAYAKRAALRASDTE